jgi:protein tyrosine/serine phosphatase
MSDAPATRSRIIEMEGCFNFRDLGGFDTADGRRVRWGRLFRSDALHHLTAADLRRIRDELGIRIVVDLRSSAERAGEEPTSLVAPPVQEHHVPLFDGERRSAPSELALDQIYSILLRVARQPIARFVRLLAESREPVLFHCAAGKDRTGLVSAVVLGAVGVREAEIVADYAETRRNLDRIVERLRESRSYDHVFTELPPETLHAEPATMEKFLDGVARDFGSMRGYLLESGVAESELASLEAGLLEEA